MTTTVATGSVTRIEVWGTARLVHAPGEYLVCLSEGTVTTGQEGMR